MSTLWKIKGLFLIAAGISFLLSVYLWFNGYKDQGVYVGLWVPSILSSGALLLTGVCVAIIWSAAILQQLWAAYEGGKSEK